MNKLKDSKKYKFWHSPLALLLLFFLIVLFGYNVVGLINKNKETGKRKEILMNEKRYLEERKDSLNSQINNLETEEGKEFIIRSKYPLARPGEKVLTIVEEESLGENEIQEANNDDFWNNFFGKNKK